MSDGISAPFIRYPIGTSLLMAGVLLGRETPFPVLGSLLLTLLAFGVLLDTFLVRPFLVPAYKLGLGNPPTFNNIGQLSQEYYSTCLQGHMDGIETLVEIRDKL